MTENFQNIEEKYQALGERHTALLSAHYKGELDAAGAAELDKLRKPLADLSLQRGAHGERINSDAMLIEQGCIGASADTPIGSYNINDCIQLFIRDPKTNKTVGAHIDFATAPETYKRILEMLPPRGPDDPPLEATLIGACFKEGDDTHPINIENAYKNEQNVNAFLAENGIVVKESHLHEGGAPIAAVFDPKTAELTREMPGKTSPDIHIINGMRLIGDRSNPKPWPLMPTFDLTVSPESTPLFLQKDQIESLRIFGKNSAEVSNRLLANYSEIPGFPEPDRWTLGFSQQFAAQVEQISQLGQAYQRSIDEIASHVEAGISASGGHGVDTMGRDRETVMEIIGSNGLYVGTNASQANKSLLDHLLHSIERGGADELKSGKPQSPPIPGAATGAAAVDAVSTELQTGPGNAASQAKQPERGRE